MPLGRAHAPGIQLRRRVDAGEIQIDDDDSADAATGQRPGDRSPDHAPAHDQNIRAVRHSQMLAQSTRTLERGHSVALGDDAVRGVQTRESGLRNDEEGAVQRNR